MRGRTKWIGFGAVVVLGLAAAVAWRYEEHLHRRPDWQLHHTAVPDAAKKIDAMVAQFERDHIYKADDYLHSAGQHPGVQIFSVTGQTHAVAGLSLDPAVRQDFATRDGIVGVALRAGQYDCIIARVTAPGDVKLWRPSHTQLSPGELDCLAGLALGAEFNTSPH
jgi:hypothetical protein